MDGVVAKKMTLDGEPTSLCDLGYCDVGLDDNWQACHSKDAAPGMHYHDKDGKPIVNLDLFPDLGAMVDHAHSLKLTAGWCTCYLLLRCLVCTYSFIVDIHLQMAITASARTTVNSVLNNANNKSKVMWTR